MKNVFIYEFIYLLTIVQILSTICSTVVSYFDQTKVKGINARDVVYLQNRSLNLLPAHSVVMFLCPQNAF